MAHANARRNGMRTVAAGRRFHHLNRMTDRHAALAVVSGTRKSPSTSAPTTESNEGTGIAQRVFNVVFAAILAGVVSIAGYALSLSFSGGNEILAAESHYGISDVSGINGKSVEEEIGGGDSIPVTFRNGSGRLMTGTMRKGANGRVVLKVPTGTGTTAEYGIHMPVGGYSYGDGSR